MTKFRGIIFDKDGTLFDFKATWSPWAKRFFLRMCDGDQERAKAVGLEVGFDVETGEFSRDSIVIAGTPEQIVHGLAPLFPSYSEAEIVQIVNAEAEAAPMAEVIPLVSFLSDLKARGLKLGVATNDAEAPARAHLSAVRAATCFDFISGSDSGFGGKPKPGQILGFCAAMGIAPESVVMVGDSLHDLMAGRAAGCVCVAVLTGLATREDLTPHADVVLDHIGQIPAWLNNFG